MIASGSAGVFGRLERGRERRERKKESIANGERFACGGKIVTMDRKRESRVRGRCECRALEGDAEEDGLLSIF